jgi:arginyl-tRNA synthetase
MKKELERQVTAAIKDLYDLDVEIDLTRPEAQFGDYTTNIALSINKQLDKNPREVAEQLAEKLKKNLGAKLQEANVAGPGFINMILGEELLKEALKTEPQKSRQGQRIVAEYSDPNPFKVLHAGHLYTSLVGDAGSRLMEVGRAKVYRVNFGGDVGLHVGKTIWAILEELGGEHPEKLSNIPEDQKLNWVSQRYVEGNEAYENDSQAKQAIESLNKAVYELHDKKKDHQSPLAQIYWTCRDWSYEGFNNLYRRLEVLPFDKYYPESAVADIGLATVKANIGTTYEVSDGAVIFKGEPYGLFTQVFINSEGLPTYAAKDVGLIYKKQEDYSPDQSFIFTDIAQKDHLAVVLKSISQYAPELVSTTTHYTHGQIKMRGGAKMSSRKGNILRATDILDAAAEASKKLSDSNNSEIVLASVKYAFLKNRIGGDIIYDPAEAVSLEGNSGPYLQYAHARARSILRKSASKERGDLIDLQAGERNLLRKITEFSEVVDRSVNELLPHHVCTYLYELCQEFNRFYERNRVINDAREALRLSLLEHYAQTLKNGLSMLGISAPDKM